MTAYKLRYTPAALNDIDDVWDGVLQASCDFDTADRYIENLADEITKIKKTPKSGIPLYYRGLFTGFYSINFKAYKVFYRINDNYVEVIRVLLSKMDYMKELFGENE